MIVNNEDRLQCVLDLSSDCYWEQDEAQRFTVFGSRGLETPEVEPLGTAPWSLWGSPAHGTRDEHQALWQAKRPFADLLVVRIEPRRGERYFSVSGEPVFDVVDRFKGYRGIARDVTKEQRAARLLHLQHEITCILDGDEAGAAPRAALRALCESERWDIGLYWRLDEDGTVMRIREAWCADIDRLQDVVRQDGTRVCRRGVGLAGSVWRTEEPLWVREGTDRASAFLCPVVSKGRTVGILDFTAAQIPEPDQPLLRLIQAVGGRIDSFCSRTAALDRLRESEERYSSTVELAAIGIGHVSLDGRFIHVNRRLCDMLGYTKQELLELTVKQISHPEDVSVTDRDARRLRAGEIDSVKIEKRYMRKDGSAIWVRITIASKRNLSGTALHDISIVEDISERKLAEERVQYLATHDEMTNLPNRAMFGQLLAHAIEHGRRYRRRFAVIFIDLDRFKTINDTLGHEAGDELLQVMALRLRESLRSSDIVARLGGDEFVVLVEELAERQLAATVARNILSVVMKPVEILGQECRVTASIGISVFPDDAQDAKALMRNADMAMYQAKEDGKNNCQFYSPDISALSVERLVIENQLRHALERHELSLNYQAKVDFKTGEINGVEALLRWSNPQLGSVPPARFIPIAEDSGLIVPIGRWAMRTAGAQGAAWHRQGLPPVCMAINISPRQFGDPNLVGDIVQMLAETGLPPHLLEFEITESMIMHDMDQAIEKLSAIKDLGVRVAIDDFGTGYSSLSQLKRFPIDTLKVDRSFIRDVPGNKEDRAITEAIISMGRNLGVVVVAEGVETAEQQTYLRGLSCDEMQGFYFSRPTEPDAFAELLRRHVPAPRD